jgi:hypothetical protein
VRDLASADVWQESLERSRARRQGGADARRSGRAAAKRPHLRLSLGTLCLAGTLLMAALGVGLAEAGGRTVAYRHSSDGHIVVGSQQRPAPAGITAPRTCQPTAGNGGYVNPLREAKVTAERIDQGVDYAGTGKLLAIGGGRITYVATTATGWPGAFIEYRLQSGPDAGCFVYYAEGVQPPGWLHVGQEVHRGQGIAYIVPGWSTGIEIGWGAGRGTRTYAERIGRWTPVDDAENVATRAGRSFSALVADLGGPAGKDEGQPTHRG